MKKINRTTFLNIHMRKNGNLFLSSLINLTIEIKTKKMFLFITMNIEKPQIQKKKKQHQQVRNNNT
jgi:hypothetical protein